MNFSALLRSLIQTPGTAQQAALIARAPAGRSWAEVETKLRRHRAHRKMRNAMQRASRRTNQGA